MGCVSSKAFVADPQQGNDFFDKYESGDILGQGSFGTVYVASCVESGDRFAVKILDLKRGRKQPDELLKDVTAEERAWARIGDHPNVVGLRQSFIEERFAFFVMEFCVCSLRTAWETEPELNEYTYARYFKEMAQALAHIHSVGVVHRDVKQDNFIVGTPDGRTVKLCDFGLAGILKGNGNLSRQCGTAPYMAPEMVTDGLTHGPPADVWSLGVIVYIAFFGCWPYQPRQKTVRDMKKAIRQGIAPPTFEPPRKLLPNVVSVVGIAFVKALLNRNPFNRPDAASCLEMPYLNARLWNQLQANEKYKRMISLKPHFLAAVDFGVLNARAPKLDEGRELHLMKLQSTARLRRVPCPSSPDESNRSTTVTPDGVSTDPRPPQRDLSDIHGHERRSSGEEGTRCTVVTQIAL